MAGVWDFLFGQSPKIGKKQVYTPGQMQGLGSLERGLGAGGGLQDLIQMLQGYVQGGPEAFQKFAQPYQEQFQEEGLPRLYEQFAGLGGGMGGGLSSSGFGQAIGGAQRNFSRDLAQMFEQNRFGAASQLGGLNAQLLGAQPYALTNRQASPGAMQMMLAAIAGNLGKMGGMGA